MPARTPIAPLLASLLALAGCEGALRPAAGVLTTPAQAPAGPPPASERATSTDLRQVPPPAAGQPWTLPECISYALAHNRSLTGAQWQTLAAQAQLELAHAAGMPSLAADGTGSTRNNDPGAKLDGTAFVSGDRSVLAGDVVASLPLYNAGSPPGAQDAARHALAAREDDYGSVAADVELAVSTAVIDCCEDRAEGQLIRDSVAALVTEAELAEDLQKQGLGLPTDALAARVRQASRDLDRRQADEAGATAQARLERLLGLPLLTAFALATPQPLPDGALAAGGPPDGREARLIALAVARRPDLAAASERAASAQSSVRSARAGAMPAVSATGGYHYDSDSYVLKNRWWSAALTVELPLFDGGMTAARTDQAQAAAGEARTAQDDLLDQIREQVHDALLDLDNAEERVPVAADAVVLARQRQHLVTEQYRGGVADMTTMLDAEDASVRAQIDLDHARFAVLRAQLQLRWACTQSYLGP